MDDATDQEYQEFHNLLINNKKDKLEKLLDKKYFDPGQISSSVTAYVDLGAIVSEQTPFNPDMLAMVVEKSSLTPERTFFNVVQQLFSTIKDERETTSFAQGVGQFLGQASEVLGKMGDELQEEAEAQSDKLKTVVNRFARALDCLLEDLDNPYRVLEEHNLIGDWYDGNEMIEDIMEKKDTNQQNVPDESDVSLFENHSRYDKQIMYVLLETDHPTDQLQRLADVMVEQGYELNEDEQELYDEKYS